MLLSAVPVEQVVFEEQLETDTEENPIFDIPVGSIAVWSPGQERLRARSEYFADFMDERLLVYCPYPGVSRAEAKTRICP